MIATHHRLQNYKSIILFLIGEGIHNLHKVGDALGLSDSLTVKT